VTGVGKPLNIRNPGASIPIRHISARTPSCQFTWQELVTLA
jgi:hypothetical protein